MKKDVFGFGLSQFTIPAGVIAGICNYLGLSTATRINFIWWCLTLSSFAFVLQLLKDKDEIESQDGKSFFGTFLLQGLMAVPFLVITPILAGNGASQKKAVATALIQITMCLSTIRPFRKTLLGPMFDLVVASGSEESMLHWGDIGNSSRNIILWGLVIQLVLFAVVCTSQRRSIGIH
eukprot:751145_1